MMFFYGLKMLDAGLYREFKQPLTPEKLESCKTVINRMTELAERARNEGLLSLDAEAQDEPNAFLKMGMTLITDATPHDVVENIMLKMIYADEADGMAVEKLLMLDGLLLMQNGCNPLVLREYLSAALGEKAMLEILNEDFSSEKYIRFSHFMRSIETQQALPESEEFNQTFGRLCSIGLSRVFLELDDFPAVLATALRGCSSAVVWNVFFHLSERLKFIIIDEWERMRNFAQKENILCAQNVIREKMAQLESQGEIVILRKKF